MPHPIAHESDAGPVERPAWSSTEELLAALPDRIRPIPRSRAFRVRLVLCAAVLTALMLIYVALVMITSYGLWSHFASDAFVESVHRLVPWPAAYAFLCVSGPILCVFLIKPLFTLGWERPASVRLDRSSDPRLFAFVDRLCQVQGAPAPREILVDAQVNASASLRHGLIGLFRDDLTLTIGLPLARGMTLRQFTGVLAHEFGHFAQGTAMRLGSVVGRSVTVFLKVAHERDGFDEALYEAGTIRFIPDPRIFVLLLAFSLFIWSVLGLLWLARMLLKGLAWVGMAATAALSRQMEYEADLHESRIVGCETFLEIGDRLLILDAARRAAAGIEQRAFAARRLPDDLPELVSILASRISALPAEMAEIREKAMKLTTNQFDSHPALRDRFAAVKRAADEPAFLLDAPASVLFSDLPGASRAASTAAYRAILDMQFRSMRLLPSSEILYEIEGDADVSGRVARITRGCPPEFCSLAIGPWSEAGTPDEVSDRGRMVRELDLARRRSSELAQGAVETARRLAEARQGYDRLGVVAALLRNGFPIDPGPAGSGDSPGESVSEARRRAAREIGSIEGELTPFSDVVSLRLRRALELRRVENGESSGLALPDVSGALVEALDGLSRSHTHSDFLRSRLAVLLGIMREAQLDQGNPLAFRPIYDASDEAHRAITSLRSAIDGIPYPFPLPLPEALPKETRPTIGHFLGSESPERDPVGVYSRGTRLLSGLRKLEDRIISALGEMAEQVELSLGLPALPALPPPDMIPEAGWTSDA